MYYTKLFQGNTWETDWREATEFINTLSGNDYRLVSVQPYGGGMNTAGIVVVYKSKI